MVVPHIPAAFLDAGLVCAVRIRDDAAELGPAVLPPIIMEGTAIVCWWTGLASYSPCTIQKVENSVK